MNTQTSKFATYALHSRESEHERSILTALLDGRRPLWTRKEKKNLTLWGLFWLAVIPACGEMETATLANLITNCILLAPGALLVVYLMSKAPTRKIG